MSVYKSKRSESQVQFISDAKQLRLTTIRVVKRFPKSYRWMITNNMLKMAGDIYSNCLRANAIYMCKDMSENDYELRHRYLMLAKSDASALSGEITFCFDMVREGNNFFEGSWDYTNAFQNWTNVASETLKKIRGVLESDKKRWKEFQNKKKEESEKLKKEEKQG